MLLLENRALLFVETLVRNRKIDLYENVVVTTTKLLLLLLLYLHMHAQT